MIPSTNIRPCPFIVRLAAGLLCFCGSALYAGSYTGNVVHVSKLLDPHIPLEGVACTPPDGIRFKHTEAGTFAIVGRLEGKRGTVVLKPEEGVWDISAYSYLRVDIENNGAGLVWINGRLENSDAKDWQHSTPSMAFIMPGERATLGFAYPRAKHLNDAPEQFNSQSGKPNGHREHWKEFAPESVVGLRMAIESTSEQLSLTDITISLAQPYGSEANRQLLEMPYLDRFGQTRQLDWSGKITHTEALKSRINNEVIELARDLGPMDFNRYGGWKNGPKLEATGFFRTEKYQGKWWLVDPSGRLFFSHGANSIGFNQKTPIKWRKELFEWLPTAEEADMEGVVEDDFAYFMRANLARIWGSAWQPRATMRVHQRLPQWGMNTIGAWSDPALVKLERTPYTAIVHMGYKWSPLGDGISDPFDTKFAQQLRQRLAKLLHAGQNDTWCVGVFIDNEIDWEQDFVRNTFAKPLNQPARQAALQYLKLRYADIFALNHAWGTHFVDWGNIDQLPLDANDALSQDISALRHLISRKYYQECREAMREVLPNHLYLGSRMHKAPKEVFEEAATYVDVLSLNLYEPVANHKAPASIDKPVLISEFHFAAPDRGVPGTGLWPVGDQLQRSRSYVWYVMSAVLNPDVVGTHWFAYSDQSAAGRPGENFQIGFVDVTDTPYPEITRDSRNMAEHFYAYGNRSETALLEVLEELWK